MAILKVTEVPVAEERFAYWGVEVHDFRIEVGGQVKSVDFETLSIEIAAARAVTYEGQVNPISAQVTKRNAYLQRLGEALSELSSIQTLYDSEEKGDPAKGLVSEPTEAVLKGLDENFQLEDNRAIKKSNCEKYIQLLKTKMDKLNNDSQTDITRLQSLAQRRDEAFTTTTTIMSAVSDTRGNTIRSIGG